MGTGNTPSGQGDAPTSGRIRRVRPQPTMWVYGAMFVVALAAAGTLSWAVNDRGRSGALPTSLTGADLSDSHLAGANLRSADLAGATLDNVNLTAADLRESDFAAVDATKLVLERACLRDTTWVGARIGAAVLDGADIRGADFARVEAFEVASAVGAIYDATTRFPPQGPFPGSVSASATDEPADGCS